MVAIKSDARAAVFHERYQGSLYSGQRHWYRNLPEYLIGSSLESVRDVYKRGANDAEGNETLSVVPGLR